ncbi:MAG TPA: hypothetical protein PLE74_06270 [Candidatus Cloacimonadota bacterium]|nr:hypothetical protein [Candidatus Cloacimonadota bacterium]
MAIFSKRLGHAVIEKEITIRDDAPQGLRDFLVMTIYELSYQPSFVREIVCRVIKKAPDRGNWSEFPNIDGEVHDLIDRCEWYSVYDIIESTYARLKGDQRDNFQVEINDFFKANGIGWKLEKGQIETRGDVTFEKSIAQVITVLKETELPTAKNEIQEAIHDLSRRPTPDITGAIQHSIACLECVSREVLGDSKSTLGELMKKTSGIIPVPLDQAISKIWGFVSEQGRHLKEGETPNYKEAELVVSLTASISTYLSKKLAEAKKSDSTGNPEW